MIETVFSALELVFLFSFGIDPFISSAGRLKLACMVVIPMVMTPGCGKTLFN
jgi:hypothetical protein